MTRWSAWLSLFASTGTLFCCALPSLLVALGMGAAMTGLVTNLPQIVWLSQYKSWVFIGSGFLIFATAMQTYTTRNAPCPIDPELAKACKSARKWSVRILAVSALIWFLGAFFAFAAPMLFV